MDGTFSFQTERIALRAFGPADIPDIHTYLNHPELAGRRYIPSGFPGEIPLSRKQVEGVFEEWGEKENGFILAVVLQESQELVGHAECGREAIFKNGQVYDNLMIDLLREEYYAGHPELIDHLASLV